VKCLLDSQNYMSHEKRPRKINRDATVYNMGFTSSATLNSAPVFDRTSSTVTPSATSISVNPSVKSTSNTHCTKVNNASPTSQPIKFTHQIRNNPTHTRLPRQRKLALLQDLRPAFLVCMFHGNHHFSRAWIADQVLQVRVQSQLMLSYEASRPLRNV
jgi:hypothetical protein